MQWYTSMNRTEPTLLRANGTVIEKPAKEDFATLVEYVRAVHEYHDEITRAANAGFDAGWRDAMRSAR